MIWDWIRENRYAIITSRHGRNWKIPDAWKDAEGESTRRICSSNVFRLAFHVMFVRKYHTAAGKRKIPAENKKMESVCSGLGRCQLERAIVNRLSAEQKMGEKTCI